MLLSTGIWWIQDQVHPDRPNVQDGNDDGCIRHYEDVVRASKYCDKILAYGPTWTHLNGPQR